MTERQFLHEQEDFSVTDVAVVHIERMDKGHWFIGITGKDGKVDHFNFFAPNARKHPISLEITEG